MRLLHVHCGGCGSRAATARPARMVDLIASHMAHGPVVVTSSVVNPRRWRCRLKLPSDVPSTAIVQLPSLG